MNERIEKLTVQALDQAVPETWTTLSYAQLTRFQEKFAELIVRECAEVCELWNTTPGSKLAKEIKEHFGVEE